MGALDILRPHPQDRVWRCRRGRIPRNRSVPWVRSDTREKEEFPHIFAACGKFDDGWLCRKGKNHTAAASRVKREGIFAMMSCLEYLPTSGSDFGGGDMENGSIES